MDSPPLTVRRKTLHSSSGSILLEHAILVALFLLLVVLLTPVISEALRSMNEAMQTPIGAGFARSGVLIINPGTGRAPTAARRPAGGKPSAAGAEVAVVLSAAERAELDFVTRRWFVRACDVARARGLLMAAEGATSGSIARELGTTEATVNAWRREFMAQAPVCGAEGGRTICRRRFVSLATRQGAEMRLGAAPRPEEERV